MPEQSATRSAAVSSQAKVTVQARDHFTKVMPVTAGRRYCLAPNGKWKDWWIETDAIGYPSHGLQRIFERFRICPDQLWFALCGVLAPSVASESDLRAATRAGCLPWTMANRQGDPWIAPEAGYLYVFPNDVYSAYWNNKGSIELTVTEV